MISLAAESLFWVAVASSAVAQAAILRGVIAGGTATPAPVRPDGTAETAPSARGRPARPLREGAWALLPGLILALVFLWTWRTIHPAATAEPAGTGSSLSAPSSGI